MKSKKEIEDLIAVLEEAIEERQSAKLPYNLEVEVCLDCMKIITVDYEAVDTINHRKHTTLESDVDRNEIGDWLNALYWVSLQ